MWSAWCGDLKVVKSLLKTEGGTQNNFGETALMYASYEGKVDCIKALVAKEGRMRDNEGLTALMRWTL